MRNVLEKVLEKFTAIIHVNKFLMKLCLLPDTVEKYYKGGQVSNDDMAHPHCMLDN
jgi:hypothetical protein